MMTDKTVHLGHNIKRLREMMGMKQEALAIELGEDWNQKKISQLETKADIDPDLLQQIAKALHMPADTIRNFDEEKMILNIQNNYEGTNTQANVATQYNINPVDEWRQAMADNRRLLDENKALYERLLKSEQEKVALLEKMLDKQ